MSSTVAAGPRERAIALAQQDLGLLVDGQITSSVSGATMPVTDPSTGADIATVARATADDVAVVVKAAQAALDGPLRLSTPRDRERWLRKLAELVDQNRDELALLESLDSGKPLAASQTVDLPLSIDNLDYYAGWPTKIYGDTIPANATDMLIYTRNEPVGVTAQIIPWNFPLFDATGRIGMAVAAGAPLILKPAEDTPLTALYLAKLVQEAGIPPGVVNIVPGYGSDVGQALVEHPGVAAVGFTGSTAVGKRIAAAAAPHLKQVSLELGGKSPNVLFADCDLPAAIDAAFSGIFLNAGQVCSAGSRLLVHTDIYDDVVQELSNRARALTVGGAFSDAPEMGPVVSRKQFGTVRDYIGIAAADGSITAGGLELPAGTEEGGFFVAPTIAADLPTTSRVVTEEIFGPVLAVERFTTFDEALTRANASDFGLAASVWSQNGSTATRFANGLKTGTVWVNCFHMYDMAVPWGGVKGSGGGRERGKESLSHLLKPKVVWNAL
jgi:aldehyde dehydrogenase (NAD+)